MFALFVDVESYQKSAPPAYDADEHPHVPVIYGESSDGIRPRCLTVFGRSGSISTSFNAWFYDDVMRHGPLPTDETTRIAARLTGMPLNPNPKIWANYGVPSCRVYGASRFAEVVREGVDEVYQTLTDRTDTQSRPNGRVAICHKGGFEGPWLRRILENTIYGGETGLVTFDLNHIPGMPRIKDIKGSAVWRRWLPHHRCGFRHCTAVHCPEFEMQCYAEITHGWLAEILHDARVPASHFRIATRRTGECREEKHKTIDDAIVARLHEKFKLHGRQLCTPSA